MKFYPNIISSFLRGLLPFDILYNITIFMKIPSPQRGWLPSDIFMILDRKWKQGKELLKSRLYKKELLIWKLLFILWWELINFIEAADQRIYISKLNLLSRICNKKKLQYLSCCTDILWEVIASDGILA